MHMTIVALGTRGDVQPMIALGQGLQTAGHQVRLIAGANFEAWVRSYGLDFAPSVDMEAVMKSEAGIAWAENGQNPFKQLNIMAMRWCSPLSSTLPPPMSSSAVLFPSPSRSP